MPARQVWLLEGNPVFTIILPQKTHDISGFSVFQEDWPW